MATAFAESLHAAMSDATSNLGSQLFHPDKLFLLSAVASFISVPIYRLALHSYQQRLAAKTSSPVAQEYHDDVKEEPRLGEALYAPHGLTSFLDGTLLTHRTADTCKTENNSPAMRSKMHSFLASLSWANHDLVTRRPSALEPTAEQPALYLQSWHESEPSAAWLWGSTAGEVLNVSADGSSRMVLSLADAATAVLSGWADRHPLSGSKLPWGYVVVRSPRDDETEMQAWRGLVLAGVRFCSAYGAKGVEVRRVH